MPSPVRLAVVLALPASCLAACHATEPGAGAPRQCVETHLSLAAAPRRDIDILFVVDDSCSMHEEQAALATAFPRFMQVLESIEGGLPNVHIGVISSSIGAGETSIANCPVGGDGGRLQSAPRLPGCAAPQGSFIYDVQDPAGAPGDRLRNYTGDLPSTFACIASLGTDGCGLEQPLEAVRMAFHPATMPPENAGFLRPDAYLAIVFITDEDDCSLSAPVVLGAIDLIDACVERGVTCDGVSPDLSTPAVYEECVPAEDETALAHPRRHLEFMKGLKREPGDVIVAGVLGPPAPLVIGSVTPEAAPALMPACESDLGRADPAVRLAWLIDQFGSHGAWLSICQPSLEDALAVVGALFKRVMANLCFPGELHAEDHDGDGTAGGSVADYDMDLDAPGIQVDCQVSDVQRLDDGTERETPLARCAMLDDETVAPDSPRPCWWMEPRPLACSGESFPTTLSPHVERVTDAPPDTITRASCLRTCD